MIQLTGGREWRRREATLALPRRRVCCFEFFLPNRKKIGCSLERASVAHRWSFLPDHFANRTWRSLRMFRRQHGRASSSSKAYRLSRVRRQNLDVPPSQRRSAPVRSPSLLCQRSDMDSSPPCMKTWACGWLAITAISENQAAQVNQGQIVTVTDEREGVGTVRALRTMIESAKPYTFPSLGTNVRVVHMLAVEGSWTKVNVPPSQARRGRWALAT
jgi:hypothetical protein